MNIDPLLIRHPGGATVIAFMLGMAVRHAQLCNLYMQMAELHKLADAIAERAEAA